MTAIFYLNYLRLNTKLTYFFFAAGFFFAGAFFAAHFFIAHFFAAGFFFAGAFFAVGIELSSSLLDYSS